MIFLPKITIILKPDWGGSPYGRGIGWGDHFLPHKFTERTFESWVNSTKQLLNAGRGHQAPRKAAHCLFFFFWLYNTVLVLPYIDMNPPQVYTSSQSWIALPPPTPYHLSGSSPCTSPKHPVSCIKHRLALRFLHDSIHVSGSGRGIQDWELVYTRGRFMSMYGKTNTVL